MVTPVTLSFSVVTFGVSLLLLRQQGHSEDAIAVAAPRWGPVSFVSKQMHGRYHSRNKIAQCS